MADYDGLTPGQVLADASVAEFIKTLGLGIAEAQKALDDNSVSQIGEYVAARDGLGGKSLLDLGLSPPFYHYQHADISCSLQLSLRVAKDEGKEFKLNFGIDDTSGSKDSGTASETESSSGSSTYTGFRQASLSIAETAVGPVSVGGQSFALTGPDLFSRAAALADALRGNPASGVERVVLDNVCNPTNPTAKPAAADDVVLTPTSVAFLDKGGFTRGVIRIHENPAGASEEWTLNATTKVTAAKQASVQVYAAEVTKQINASGFTAILSDGEGGRMLTCIYFDHDLDYLRPDDPDTPPQMKRIATFAELLNATKIKVDLSGFTDTSGPDAYNVDLGNRRVKYFHQQIVAQGGPEAQLVDQPSTGEARWKPANKDGERRAEHRLAEATEHGTTDYFILVKGDETHVLDAISPDNRADATKPANGFIYLFKPAAGGKAATGIVAGGKTFPVSGGTPEAKATALAAAINADASVKIRATAAGNVATLCAGDGPPIGVTMLTTSKKDMTVSGGEGVTITQQFSKSRSSVTSTEKSGNRTVAFGASIGFRESRQFEMNVTGNSTIAARLVAIPAPPEFLATIKDYLKE